MLSIELVVADKPVGPPLDLDGDLVRIGSDSQATIPIATAARYHAELARLRDDGAEVRWRVTAHQPVVVGGVGLAPGSQMILALPATLLVAGVSLIVKHSLAQQPSPIVRTSSLARELMRGLLGEQAGSISLVVDAGPAAGQSRVLAAPPSRTVIGRGEEADWVIFDEDLSRVHVAVERTWDGTRIYDLESKNGTRINGVVVTGAGAPWPSESVVDLGLTNLRLIDPTDAAMRTHLVARDREMPTPSGNYTVPSLSARLAAVSASASYTAIADERPRHSAASAAPRTTPATGAQRRRPVTFVVAIIVAGVAIAGLLWLLH